MSRARSMALVLSAAGLMVACRGGGTVDYRVLSTEGDSPYLGADRVLVAVERSGQLDPATALEFDVEDARWPLRGIAYGDELRLRVEARAGNLVLARGRSYPFAMNDAEGTPMADVWLGSLGRFGAVQEGVDAIALAASAHGAFGIDRAGRRFELVAHDPASGRAAVVRGPAEDDDLLWVSVPGGLVGVGADHWLKLGPDGEREAERLDTGYEPGAAAAGWPGGVLMVTPRGAIVSLMGTPGSGARLELGALEGPFDRMRMVAVPVGEGTRGVLLADETVFVLDPTGERAPLRVEAVGAGGASLAFVLPGLVAVIGGTDGEGPVADVMLLVLGGERPQRLTPPPLFEARRDPSVVRLRDGLVLIVGGLGADGALASAELLQVGLTDLPGDVSVTGSLPWPMASPSGARLADGSVLVVGAEGSALYFDPRDPAP